MGRVSKRAPPIGGATAERIAGWADAQLAAWRDVAPLDADELRRRLMQREAASISVFLFDFAGGCVSLRRKTCRGDGAIEGELLRRAGLFLRLFRDVVTGFELDCSFPLAIDVDDHPFDQSGSPIFAFQKRAGSPLILLPDVDILGANYFVSPEFDDTAAFDDKAEAAVFAGATTGDTITREAVERLSVPRLRSAVYFRDAPDVSFTLPKIVQCDSADTVALVEALGVGGPQVSWAEQFGYKYLLSMDGNGATCSRVALALRSHCVLIKYESDFQLFYFDGLEAGREFLSVSKDEEVHSALETCRKHPRRAAAIAEAGRLFAREHLTRLPVMAYVARLFEAYGRTVETQGGEDLGGPDNARLAIDCYGHIQNVGDTRPVPGGWLGGLDARGAIEGFGLEPAPGIEAFDVSYQAVLADGSLSGVCFGYDFCGTRNQNRRLHGFRAALGGDAARTYRLSYLATFEDGALVGPYPGGATCRSPSGAELTGLRLIVEPKPGADASETA